jgi:hypothetical protein
MSRVLPNRSHLLARQGSLNVRRVLETLRTLTPVAMELVLGKKPRKPHG